MGTKYKYEFIVDGEVRTRLFAKTREELKQMIDIMAPWEDKHSKKNGRQA